MSAASRVFPNELGGLDVLCKFWVPRNGRWKQEPRNKTLYPLWEKSGHLIFTGDEATDFNRIEADLLEMDRETPFKVFTADRAYATQLLTNLGDRHGMTVHGISQGARTINEAMVRFEGMILDGVLRHGKNPVLDWNIGNATVKVTSTGLMHLDKSATTQRIDGLAATINAMVGWLHAGGETGNSIYETEGLFTLDLDDE